GVRTAGLRHHPGGDRDQRRHRHRDRQAQRHGRSTGEDGGQITYTITLSGGPGEIDPDTDLVFNLANGEQVTIHAGDTSGSYTRIYTDAEITNESNINNSILDVDSGGSEYENLQTTGTTSVDVDSTPEITDLTPAASGGDVIVDEDDLSDGTDADKESTTQEGSFTITSGDGIDSLTIDGHSIISDGTFTATSFTTALGNTLSVTDYDENTGEVTYSYTLNSNTLTHGYGDNGENSVYENFTVSVTDTDGDPATDTLSVQIVDDVPDEPTTVNKTVDEGSGSDTNLMVVLDLSGSMDDDPNVSGFDTRLAVAKAAITDLINAYDDMGSVAVQIVTFSSGASTVGSEWMSAADALAWIDSLSDYAGNGATDYDAALAEAQSAFTATGKIDGAQNVSYFLSDGVPTDGSGESGPGSSYGNGIGSSEQANWENFLSSNDITSYALGMGSGVSSTPLDPIAYDGAEGEELPAIVVTDLSQLSDVLSETVTVPENGNLVTEGNINSSFGADGAGGLHIVAFAHDSDGDPNTPADVYDTNSNEYDSATNTLTISTYAGGTLVINFATGAYSYAAPDGVSSDITDEFTYMIEDGDGDRATGSFTITVQDGAPVASDDVVSVNEGYWDIGSDTTESVTVPGWSDSPTVHDPNLGSTTIDPEWWDDQANTHTVNITADASHPASISVYVDVHGFRSGDNVKLALYDADTNTQVGSEVSVSSDGTVTFNNITQSGNYYIRVSGHENDTFDGRGKDLWVTVNDLKYTAYDNTTTLSVTAPSLVWLAAAVATGNVLANDDAGADGGLLLASVNGVNVSGGVDIAGAYGTLHIDENGDYTYTPNPEDLAQGASDSFTYTVVDADGSESSATLTVDINDHVYSTSGTNESEVLMGDGGDDVMNGLAGNDVIVGGAGNDTLNGGAGNDHLYGGDGDDTLIGGIGSDILEGGAGNDTLSGGDDSDALIGGIGNDILTGGDGDDIFIWEAGDEGTSGAPAEDIVTDFNDGDVLDLSDLLVGEESGDLTDYLNVTQSGSNVVIEVSHNPGDSSGVTQVITLENTQLSDLGANAGDSQSDIINSLVNNGHLNVDHS
ncbi:type I secretion C-terminal target domain-containing protein, partial [Marinobacterium lacunae]|uniref:type I secretion C-terminal target domain-containing protein n=1 Tax=Marinobacterium lacunae TaxID=1232683 RepID=UPI0012DD3469